MPFYESQPVIYPLHRLLEEVLAGEIRIPRFQRPGTEYTWRPQQRGDLLDSIYRGFPIGTVLLWSTSERVSTLHTVGGAAIRRRQAEGKKLRLVLDGHQRLSTLISVLGSGIEGYRRAQGDDVSPLDEDWIFDLAAVDLENPARERFRLLKPGESPSGSQIPLSIVLDRVKLNQWVRNNKKLTGAQIRLADTLRDRLREYSLPVATLAAESLDVATETFKRINSSGTPMSDFHMVAALAYTDKFDPQQHFEQVRSAYLEPVGWEEVEDSDLLRVCAGIVRERGDKSQHPAKLDVSGLGRALRDDPSLIEVAAESISQAAQVLAQVAGVHGPGILPYSWQLIVLAIEIATRQTRRIAPKERPLVARWFWLTTYGGVFAGVNSAIVDRAGRALHDMLTGDDETAMRVDIANVVDEPKRFDFRAARARACMLSIARYMDQGKLDGQAHLALTRGVSAVHTLSPRLGASIWHNLTVESSPDHLKALREAIRKVASGSATADDVRVLGSVGMQAKNGEDLDDLLERRRAKLIEAEAHFVEKLGLSWRDD